MEYDQRKCVMLYASVVLDLALETWLDYSIPPELAAAIKPGVRVEVPVRNKLQKGTLVAIKESTNFPNIRSIHRVLSEVDVVTPQLFELALWMSKYYCTSLQQVLKIMVPSSLRKEMQPKQQLYVIRKKTREELKEHCVNIRQQFPAQAEIIDVMLLVKKGILLTELLEESKSSRSSIDTLVKKGFLEISTVRIDRSPLIDEEYFKTKSKVLNVEQKAALEKILQGLEANRYETHLLFGVTGSGKTEVYLQALEQVLQQGKGAIMLVPEISLTTQTIERFRSRFDKGIAILHHRLSHGERFDEWHKIRDGRSPIVIGARSAIFSPVKNLGLIIVDEEHEQSYKQSEEQPCYNARDLAVMRGKLCNGLVILGSATPSLESYYNCITKKYILSKLTMRAEKVQMPRVTIIDMKKEFEKAKGFTNFSDALITGIQKRFESGEQTILFLNRRGYHTNLFCLECKKAVKCQQCDISLTFHLGDNTLACHLCGFIIKPPPQKCPSCQHANPMKYKGVGTELIEKNIHALLPGIRTLRMDADTTRHKGSHQKLLKAFSSGKADVLIGTQMIAKGLHFPNVTLVGILNADASLNIPDYKASEIVFQLVTQVSGRAGRGEIPGEVILQTHLPENSTLKLAAACNYEEFFEEELAIRKMFRFPPFLNLIKIAFSGTEQKATFDYAEKVRHWFMMHLKDTFEWHPVIPAGYAKVKGYYRYQFMFRGKNMMAFQQHLQDFKQMIKPSSKVNMRVDVNPTSTFF